LNAKDENYELLEIFGQTVLFTNMRIDRKTVPDELFAYDVRHDDECQGEICEVKPFVMVNHWGTILCKVPIEMSDGDCRFVDENDYSYMGEVSTLDEYMSEQSEEPEMTDKPKCPLINQNGNIFNLMGIATRTLKENGMSEQAKEMCGRIKSSGSYAEALGIIGEYVEITSIDECEDETEDMDMEMEMR
jgi:hypothetical protein